MFYTFATKVTGDVVAEEKKSKTNKKGRLQELVWVKIISVGAETYVYRVWLSIGSDVV